ncbi:MAG: DUF1501 domain-containing protein [Myxococcales bacterium]|nr:DUF1501 domain-containing protein [Myxococcales bacterium]MBL0198083.1 DUF1501 domain-containing protein [Myxococcales bacterium]HQY61589.1 DUF1501 domain-containing protein [Polyangiaceae bacterium]
MNPRQPPSHSRRTALQLFSAGALASLFAGPRLARAAEARPAPKAKALIVLWMNGGPSHVDTWDPKPGTRVGGPHKAIRTATPGLSISEHLPELARLSGKLAVVRGLTSKEGNHQRASYLYHTGYAPNPTVDHPSLGGWVSKRLGAPQGGLPAFVSLGGPSRGAGFFGVQHGPFVLQRGGAMPQNVAHAPGVDGQRFDARLRYLDSLEQDFATRTGDPKVEGRRALTGQAVALMRAPQLSAFDLSTTPKATLDAFGDSDFGRGCLVASQLVGAGVRFVEVSLDGWDTHTDNFTRTKKLMGVLDPAFAALLQELERRGLLGTTAVAWMGDFGRTPRINANEGRDHHPGAASAVLAGAGVRGGQVVGETDAEGQKVTKRPVSASALLATLGQLVGLAPDDAAISPVGRPIALTDGGLPVPELLL